MNRVLRKLGLLLFCAVFVLGVTACGGEEAQEGRVSKVLSSSSEAGNADSADKQDATVPEATAAPTPEPTATPEPTPTPEPKVEIRSFTEVGIAEEKNGYKQIVSNRFWLIDGEFPDKDATIAEVFFSIPEGQIATWEDFKENAELLKTPKSYIFSYTKSGTLDVEFCLEQMNCKKSYFIGKFGEDQSAWPVKYNDMHGEVSDWQGYTITEEEFAAVFEEFVNNYSITDYQALFCSDKKANHPEHTEMQLKYALVNGAFMYWIFSDEPRENYEDYLANPDKYYVKQYYNY